MTDGGPWRREKIPSFWLLCGGSIIRKIPPYWPKLGVPESPKTTTNIRHGATMVNI